MSPQRCETCRFFKSISGLVGYCLRFPPTVAADGSACVPVVNPTDWCGEWAAAPTGKPPHG